MALDPTDAVIGLLDETKVAHGRFEASELKGVYDQDWPSWYARYAVDHGLGDLVGHRVSADALAEFLATSNGEFERLDPQPIESWTAYTARRIVTEL
jgi:hypothetical protein